MSKKLYSVKGCCDYCATLMCNICVSNNKFCHGNDNGRSICALHTKTSKTIHTDSNRIAVSIGGLKGNYQSLFAEFGVYKSNLNLTVLFNSFYTEFHVLFNLLIIF